MIRKWTIQSQKYVISRHLLHLLDLNPGFLTFKTSTIPIELKDVTHNPYLVRMSYFWLLPHFWQEIFFNRNFSGIFGRVEMFFRPLSERPEKLCFCLYKWQTQQIPITWFTLFLYNYYFFLIFWLSINGTTLLYSLITSNSLESGFYDES